MFERGSHWVSSRMSEVSTPRVLQHPPSREQGKADTASASGSNGGARPELHVPTKTAASPEATAATEGGTQADAASPLPAAPEKGQSQISVLPVAADLYRDEGAPRERHPSATARDAESAPRADLAAEPPARVTRRVLDLDDAPSDTSSVRRIRRPWLLFAGATMVAVLAIGPSGMSIPNEAREAALRAGAAGGPHLRGLEPAETDAPRQAAEALPVENDAPPAAKDAQPHEERATTNRGGRPTADPLRFADAALCMDMVCKTLVVHHAPDVLRPSLGPAHGAAVGVVHAVQREAVHKEDVPSAAGPASPSPPHASTDAAPSGAETQKAPPRDDGDTEERVLSIPLDDLGEIEFVLLPRDGTETPRARVALRQRDGRELAQFDLKVDDALIPDVPQARVDEDKDQQKEEEDGAPSGAAADEADPRETAAEAPPVARTTKRAPRAERPKATQRRAKASQPVKQPVKQSAKKVSGGAATGAQAQRPPAAPQPRGLFPLQSPPPAASEPAPREAASAAPRKKAPEEISTSDLASQPTPRTRGQPPGFETLMSLGGGFAIEQP